MLPALRVSPEVASTAGADVADRKLGDFERGIVGGEWSSCFGDFV
jgi:hypothetical protein